MKNVNVYVDGSHFKGGKHGNNKPIGLGAYCKVDGSEYRLSSNITQDTFRKSLMVNGTVSNPTAELAAAAYALKELSVCKTPIEITIIADYEGVKNWCEYTWSAKKSYIVRILSSINRSTAAIKSNGGNVNYRWVRGHQTNTSDPDVQGNHCADEMAKCKKRINNFRELVNYLNLKQKVTT